MFGETLWHRDGVWPFKTNNPSPCQGIEILSSVNNISKYALELAVVQNTDPLEQAILETWEMPNYLVLYTILCN